MRSAVITPVPDCSQPLAANRKYLGVQLLTRQVLLFIVETKCKLSELFGVVCDRMCHQGLQDAALFGLAVPIDGEYVFVDPEAKISKYAPKAWKSSQGEGLDGSRRPLLQLSLRVKFYVDCHLLLRDRVGRHHYYLQLRENVLVHRQACGQQACLLLAAWALQADVGNYSNANGKAYFQPAEYFPKWFITKFGVDYILERAAALHRHNANMSRSDAELAYIREASAVEAPHNLHLYRLRRRKSDPVGSVLLGICPNGIELYQEERNNARKLLASFVWTNINNLTFEKRKFEIGALTQKFTFYTGNDETAKHLFLLCKEIHQFTQSLKDRLAEIKQHPYEERRSKSLKVTSHTAHDWEYLSQPGSSSADPHTSVVSNSSSNTTSGIVSDRTAHSLDGSDEELDLDVTISSPHPDSAESGVDSLTRSHSKLDSNSALDNLRSPQGKGCTPPLPNSRNTSGNFKSATLPRRKPSGGPAASTCAPAPSTVAPSIASVAPSPETVAPPTMRGGVRNGSVHSGSSQQSSSTVRSRYALVPPPPPPLPPPPATVHMTTLAAQTECSAHVHTSVFSSPSSCCCSTCVEEDDLADVCATDQPATGDDGAFPVCEICHQKADSGQVAPSTCTCRTNISSGAGNASTILESCNHLQHLSQSSMTSAASAASTADSTRALEDGGGSGTDRTVSPGCSLSAELSALSGLPAIDKDRDDDDNVSVRSGASATSNCGSQSATLDYSVHSAHTSVGSVITTPGTFPRRKSVSNTFDTDSDYVQVPYDKYGQFRIADSPTGVAMSKVTTVTRFGVAQSCQPGEEEVSTEPLPENPPAEQPQHRLTPQEPLDAVKVVSVPAASAPPSSEAPARFITTKPMVNVFKAIATVAVTQPPSFASFTLARQRPPVPHFVRSIVEPQPTQAIKPMAVHAAAAPAQTNALLPTISPNNYLDVRASRPTIPAIRRSASSNVAVSLPSHPVQYVNIEPAASATLADWGKIAPRLPRSLYAGLVAAAAAAQLPQHDLAVPSVAPRSAGADVTSELRQNQLDQFQQQLLSDGDFVTYPLQDPDISRQDYMDAKDFSMAAGALPPPPPYRAPRDSTLYRSAPSVADGRLAAAADAPVLMAAPDALSSLYGSAPSESLYGGVGGGEAASLYGGSARASSVSSMNHTYSSARSVGERLECLERLGLRPRHHLSSHSLASGSATYPSLASLSAGSMTSGDLYSDLELYRAALLARAQNRSTVTRARSDDNLLSTSSDLAGRTLHQGRPPPPYSQARSQRRSQHLNGAQTLPHPISTQLHPPATAAASAVSAAASVSALTLPSRQQQHHHHQQFAADGVSVSQRSLQKHQALIQQHLDRMSRQTATSRYSGHGYPSVDMAYVLSAEQLAPSMQKVPRGGHKEVAGGQSRADVWSVSSQQLTALQIQQQRLLAQQMLEQQRLALQQQHKQQEQKMLLQTNAAKSQVHHGTNCHQIPEQQQPELPPKQQHKQKTQPPSGAGCGDVDVTLEFPLISALMNDRLLSGGGGGSGQPRPWELPPSPSRIAPAHQTAGGASARRMAGSEAAVRLPAGSEVTSSEVAARLAVGVASHRQQVHATQSLASRTAKTPSVASAGQNGALQSTSSLSPVR